MAFKFNPFSGTFDFAGSKVDTYLDGEVATYDDLPLDPAAAPLNSAWLVREASGLWFLTRKPAGIYVRSAAGGTDRDADYTYAGTFPDVFSDANFVVYNDADSTKNVKFSAANVTTGTTRTLTVPDASGTLPLLESANTYSANQTLDGTNNVAPNQTAASGSSLMTRDLGDARFLDPRFITGGITEIATGTHGSFVRSATPAYWKCSYLTPSIAARASLALSPAFDLNARREGVMMLRCVGVSAGAYSQFAVLTQPGDVWTLQAGTLSTIYSSFPFLTLSGTLSAVDGDVLTDGSGASAIARTATGTSASIRWITGTQWFVHGNTLSVNGVSTGLTINSSTFPTGTADRVCVYHGYENIGGIASSTICIWNNTSAARIWRVTYDR
jgi:hypothetical protein